MSGGRVFTNNKITNKRDDGPNIRICFGVTRPTSRSTATLRQEVVRLGRRRYHLHGGSRAYIPANVVCRPAAAPNSADLLRTRRRLAERGRPAHPRLRGSVMLRLPLGDGARG